MLGARAEGRLESVRVAGSLTANNGDVLRNAAMLGRGIIMQPSFIVGPDIVAGRLEAPVARRGGCRPWASTPSTCPAAGHRSRCRG